MQAKIIILLIVQVSLISSSSDAVYYSSCSDDVDRVCASSSNRTDFLLSLKKGGTNLLSTDDYLYDFFLCEEYNFDCGYLEQSTSYTTIANGVSLNMNSTILSSITTSSTTYDLILPYLSSYGDTAKCGMTLFPLTLTAAQSEQVLDGYMSLLATKISYYYDLERDSTTEDWADININIRTAIMQKFKANSSLIQNSDIWDQLVVNNYTGISDTLKQDYQQNSQQIDLHSAYLIDSVTQTCNKLQSVNFLVDESGSIGATGFALALDFLETYINSTNDDLTKISINFFDATYDAYIQFGNTLAYFQAMIPAKAYRAKGTYTGLAINQTVDRILAANFSNGLPKILIVLTDGGSYDSVVQAANYAIANDIVPLAVGIGSSVNTTQLLQIAKSTSNMILISSYADLPKLVEYISNYFCKQIITVELGETIYDNYVRVPESPSYFRVIKSNITQGQQYQLDIYFQEDPVSHNQSVVQSQIDPFPDEYTEYTTSESYTIFQESVSSTALASTTFVPMKVYFIKPEHEVTYTVKKNQTNTMNVTISYIAVRGNQLGFNLTLTKCSTLTCTVQRAKHNSSSSTTNTTTSTTIITPSAEDMSIFIVIGVTLALMACLCSVFIVVIRKFKDEDEENREQLQENTNGPDMKTQEHIQSGLIPADSNKKIQGEQDCVQEISQ